MSKKINLHWDPPQSDGGSRLTGFNIYRWGDGEEPSILSRRMESDRLYNDTEVKNGIAYNYYVTALNDVGESDPTETIRVVPLGVPTDPRVLVLRMGDGFISLSWQPPLSTEGDPLIGYNLYKGKSNDNLVLFKTLGDLVSFNDTEVENGMKYFYSVTAFNSVGESIRCNVVHETPLGHPSAPINLTLTGGVGFIELSWESPEWDGGSPLTGFAVYRKSGPDPILEVYTCMDTVLSFKDIDVSGGVAYSYFLVAKNKVGSSPMSDPATITHQEASMPPDDIDGVSGDGFVNITWKPPLSMKGSTVLGYKVLRGSSAVRMVELNMTGAGVLFFNDTSVVNGETYFYSVQAICEVWRTQVLSKGSDVLSFTPKKSEVPIMTERPSAPIDLKWAADGKMIVLTWDRPLKDGNSTITGFRIYRTIGDERIAIGSTLASVMTYVDGSVRYDTNYTYEVTAQNAVGESAPSGSVTCSIPSPVKEPEVNKIVPIIAGILAIILVLVIAAVLFFLLRGKKKEPSIPEVVLTEVKPEPITEPAGSETPSEFTQPPPVMEDPIVEKADPDSSIDDLLGIAKSDPPTEDQIKPN